MMICPETYYKENLEGKTEEQVRSVIRGLKQEIGRLKNILEHPDYKPTMYPTEDTRLWCNRLYLERAKQALVEMGGVYTPSKAELKADEFNANLPYLSEVEFCIGGFFNGYETKTYIIEGDCVKTETESMQMPCVMPETGDDEEMDKESLIEGLMDLHIGEWRRNYDPGRWGYMVCDGIQWYLYLYFSNGHRAVKIEGSNDYPYNFNRLLELFNIEAPDDEEGE